jgi:hypothetical protein
MMCRNVTSIVIAACVVTATTVNLRADENYYDGVGANQDTQLELISLGSEEAEGCDNAVCCPCCPDPWVISRDPIFAIRTWTI